jgi:3-dehydroquinate synthase
VHIRTGIAKKLSGIVTGISEDRRLGVVTDRTLDKLYGTPMRQSLASAGFTVDWLVLAPGESIKSSRIIANLHERWFDNGYDRSTPIMAFGGGTVGDAVGFAAATFKRGLPLVQVPTTLIGQVDSALGGKVGINHIRGKNLVGCYYHPAAVVIDPAFLTTLPGRELKSGLAEVVKYGIIVDAPLLQICERSVAGWTCGSKAIDQATIRRCVSIKLKIVRADERDTGLRHILNFGHTLGHAFEAWGGFRLLKHGEAVTLGMIAASRIARLRGILAASDFDRITVLCRLIAPTRRAVRFDAVQIAPYLKDDKKRALGRNAWVLPVRIGKVTIVRDVADKEIRAAIGFTREWLGAER